MRAALGAGRWRLVRQLLAESTLLSVVAGGFGLAFAWATLGVLTRFVSRFTQRIDAIGLDPWVLAFTLAVAVVSGLVFGLVPALSTRSDVLPSLKQGSLGSGVSAGRRRLQDGLVVAQVAVSVVLLVGASLLLASVWRLQQVDSGYRADRVLAATVEGAGCGGGAAATVAAPGCGANIYPAPSIPTATPNARKVRIGTVIACQRAIVPRVPRPCTLPYRIARR